jgi:ribosomal-protein-alanine N-acetyltransferase
MQLENESFPLGAYSERTMLDLFGQNPQSFAVATLDGNLVGYVNSYVRHGIGRIRSLAVSAKLRRLGIGKILLEEALRRFTELGLTCVELEVRPTNTPAIALYEACGFSISHVLPCYYKSKDSSAYVMRKAIADRRDS